MRDPVCVNCNYRHSEHVYVAFPALLSKDTNVVEFAKTPPQVGIHTMCPTSFFTHPKEQWVNE